MCADRQQSPPRRSSRVRKNKTVEKSQAKRPKKPRKRKKSIEIGNKWKKCSKEKGRKGKENKAIKKKMPSLLHVSEMEFGGGKECYRHSYTSPYTGCVFAANDYYDVNFNKWWKSSSGIQMLNTVTGGHFTSFWS